jgi:predicted RNA-binding Zn ribbon-like protein
MAQRVLLDGRPSSAAKLIGGRLCLDFVNSVGARNVTPSGRMSIRGEMLRDYLDLLVWGRHVGALTQNETQILARESSRNPKRAAAVLHRAIRLRETLYQIFMAILSRKKPEPAYLSLLNDELRVAREAERLVFKKPVFTWQWNRIGTPLDRVLHLVARSAAELLTMDDFSRLHRCRGSDCGWIFLDSSKNRRRRWCDMRDCGNLDKVRKFRRRQERTQD